jgi:hypothetical protein
MGSAIQLWRSEETIIAAFSFNFRKVGSDKDIKEENMRKEIQRNNWSRFCRKFSKEYRFRASRVNADASDLSTWSNEVPVLGLTLTKKGRRIDGFELYVGQTDPEQPFEPALTVSDAAELILEQDPESPVECLRIKSKDGSEAMVELGDPSRSGPYKELLERLAYSLYERRGHADGHDRADWHEAKRCLDDAAERFAH